MIARALAAAAAAVVLTAQTAPPVAPPSGPPKPYRPVIIINANDYLRSPSPAPHHGAKRKPLPAHTRKPQSGPTPEVFYHAETSPRATPH